MTKNQRLKHQNLISAERSTPRKSSKRSARRCAEEWEGVQGGDVGGVWGAGEVMGQAAIHTRSSGGNRMQCLNRNPPLP